MKKYFGILLLISLWASGLWGLTPGQKYDFFCKDGQHFRGAVFVRETKTSYIIKIYYSDQEKTILKSELVKPPQPLDTVAPDFETDPPAGLVNNVSVIFVKYSEEMLFAERAQNYKLSGTAKNTLAIQSVTRQPNNTYKLSLNGEAADGLLRLSLAGITDLSGNALRTNSVQYTLDVTAPECLSDLKPDSSIGKLDILTLKCSEAVQGLQKPENYLISGAGKGTLTLEKVIVKDNTVAQIYFTGTLQPGPVQITLQNITDQAGNAAHTKALQFQADPLPPAITAEPAAGSSVTQLAQVKIAFSKPVTGAQSVTSYQTGGISPTPLKISSVECSSQTECTLVFNGKPAAGEFSLKISGLKETNGNPVPETILKWTIIREPLLETQAETMRNFRGNVISLNVSYGEVQGQYNEFFKPVFWAGLQYETDVLFRTGPLKTAERHPLLPGLLFSGNYVHYVLNGRSIIGGNVLAGPVWYVPFFPLGTSRFAISLSAGYTVYQLTGLTFSGEIRTLLLSPQLAYQLLIGRILGSVYVRQNMVLDAAATLFDAQAGLAVGYVF